MAKYRDQARAEARSFARRQPLFGEIVAEFLAKKGTTDHVHLNDYPSGEGDSLADRSYSLMEAARVIEDLEEFEEEDEAYWQGKGIREALRIAAALTYRNAVHQYFTNVISEINDTIGNIEIPWTMEDRYRMEMEAKAGGGVLDWDPSIKPFDRLSDREFDRLKKQHEARLIQEIQLLISEAIKNV